MNFGIRARLISLSFLVSIFVAVTAYVTFHEVIKVKIFGPHYINHINDKDYLADILPPPAYAIEIYLKTHQYGDFDISERPALLKEMKKLQEDFEARWDFWLKSEKEPSLIPKMQQAHKLGQEEMNLIFEFIAKVDAGAPEMERDVILHQINNKYNEHLASILDMVATINQRLAARDNEMKMIIVRSDNQVIYGNIITVILILLGCYLIGRSIIRPITRVAGQLGAGADQLNNAASEVSTGAQRIAQGASEQAASLEETTASLEELSATCSQNANNARQANALASEATQASESGENAARRATAEVALQMKELTTAIEAIRTSTDKTTLVVESIDDIAIQINLLALNAAVEAARAGEAGLGFAVVADEVRNLAARSTEEAKNTSALIREARANTERVQQVSRQVQEYLARTLDQEMVANFQKLVVMVRKVSQLSAEVAAASDEQSRGVGQINAAVAEMDKVTQENAANAEQSAASSEEMQSQVVSVREEVGQLNKIIGLANSTEEQSSIGNEHKGNHLRSPSQLSHSHNGQAKKDNHQQSHQQNNGRTADRDRKPADMLPLTDEEASEHKGDFSRF